MKYNSYDIIIWCWLFQKYRHNDKYSVDNWRPIIYFCRCLQLIPHWNSPNRSKRLEATRIWNICKRFKFNAKWYNSALTLFYFQLLTDFQIFGIQEAITSYIGLSLHEFQWSQSNWCGGSSYVWPCMWNVDVEYDKLFPQTSWVWVDFITQFSEIDSSVHDRTLCVRDLVSFADTSHCFRQSCENIILR